MVPVGGHRVDWCDGSRITGSISVMVWLGVKSWVSLMVQITRMVNVMVRIGGTWRVCVIIGLELGVIGWVGVPVSVTWRVRVRIKTTGSTSVMVLVWGYRLD